MMTFCEATSRGLARQSKDNGKRDQQMATAAVENAMGRKREKGLGKVQQVRKV